MTPAQRRYYEKNRLAVIARARECALRDPEKRKAYDAAYYQARKAELKAKQAAWRKEHPELVRAQIAARRAKKKGCAAMLTPSQRQAIQELYIRARALTKLTGEAYHVDHVFPLAKGGLHHPSNLQILRGIENLQKGTRCG